MSIKEKLSDWSGPITALVAVAALGVTAGYYTASSENAALRRDLGLATNGRGLAEAMATLEQLSDAANNVFRFERHAQELAEMAAKLDELTKKLRAAEDRTAKTELELETTQQLLSNAEGQILDFKQELKEGLSTSEEFHLKAQTSKSFFEATQTVGLADVYSTFVSVNTPAGQSNMSTGEVTIWRTDYTTCKLTLTSVDYDADQASWTPLITAHFGTDCAA
jgi:hypothetical protein